MPLEIPEWLTKWGLKGSSKIEVHGKVPPVAGSRQIFPVVPYENYTKASHLTLKVLCNGRLCFSFQNR